MSNEDPFSNPYQATAEVAVDPYAANLQGYPGIGRGVYFLINMALFLFQMIVGFVDDATWGMPIAVGSFLFLTAISVGVTSLRMINQGSSGWLGLLAAVPLANIFVWLRCLMCPEGYADHRELDTAGKIIGVLALIGTLFFIGALTLLVFA